MRRASVCVLTLEDTIFTTHRGHGQALAKGIDLNSFMAEIYGRRDGCCKGKSGSMHIACKKSGVAGSNGIVGAGLPISLGTAFASMYKGEDSVTVCFFGDGASNQGTFHESLNMAALWNLPVIFCCENNGWDPVHFPEGLHEAGKHQQEGRGLRHARGDG